MARLQDRWYKLSEIPLPGVMKAAITSYDGWWLKDDFGLEEDEDPWTVLTCVYEVGGHHAEFEIRLNKQRELVYLVPRHERHAQVLTRAFSRAMRGK